MAQTPTCLLDRGPYTPPTSGIVPSTLKPLYDIAPKRKHPAFCRYWRKALFVSVLVETAALFMSHKINNSRTILLGCPMDDRWLPYYAATKASPDRGVGVHPTGGFSGHALWDSQWRQGSVFPMSSWDARMLRFRAKPSRQEDRSFR